MRRSCEQVNSYVLQPEQIIPGVADYYATSGFDGFDFANLLLKRVGRPIKIDNNTIVELSFSKCKNSCFDTFIV
jgi:hypothetical protein